MITFIGVDPGTKACAIAAVGIEEDTLMPVALGHTLLSARKGLVGVNALASMGKTDLLFPQIESYDVVSCHIEFMEARSSSKRGISPDTMIKPAVASGIVARALTAYFPNAEYKFLEAGEWKGRQTKVINQGRTYRRLGWKDIRRSGYCVPEHIIQSGQPFSDWEHIGDAYGIALRALDDWVKETKRKRMSGK